MKRNRTAPRFVLLACTLMACPLIACNGTIGDTADNLPLPEEPRAEADTSAADGLRIWRLSNQQYTRAISRLLGENEAITDDLIPEVSGHGFANTVSQNSIGLSRAVEYQFIAQTMAANAVADPERMATIWPCGDDMFSDAGCVERFVEDFGRRAFRRDLLEEERQTYIEFFTGTRNDTDGPTAVALTVETMLQSPFFLYRTEVGDLEAELPAVGELVELTNQEKATFLAFTLWGEPPDDALLESFEDPSTPIAEHAARMLQDPRFAAGFDDFMQSLLELPTLDFAAPAVGYEADWNALRESMRREPRAFLDHLFFSGEVPADFAQLWTADYNFADERLAPLYGVAAPATAFSRVQPPEPRPGMLGQLGVLASHSLPDGTSPPRRGKLVARRLLCRSIPEPPDNIMPEEDYGEGALTTRDFFEAITGEGTCGAACHVFLNPPGFALEEYDSVGVWRDTENGAPIRTEVDLSSFGIGTIDGAAGLGEALAGSDEARECLAREYYRFAMGRLERPENAELIEQLQARFVESDGDLRTFVTHVLTHPAMAQRRVR